MNNLDLREYAKLQGVKFWQISEALGKSESTLTRKMRQELPLSEKEKIYSIINELAASQAK